MTKPSKGAMRAAEEILAWEPPDDPECNPFDHDGEFRRAYATIIDHETGYLELLEAAEKARTALDAMMGDTDVDDDESLEFQAMQTLSAAIAKAKGEARVKEDENE